MAADLCTLFGGSITLNDDNPVQESPDLLAIIEFRMKEVFELMDELASRSILDMRTLDKLYDQFMVELDSLKQQLDKNND